MLYLSAQNMVDSSRYCNENGRFEKLRSLRSESSAGSHVVRDLRFYSYKFAALVVSVFLGRCRIQAEPCMDVELMSFPVEISTARTPYIHGDCQMKFVTVLSRLSRLLVFHCMMSPNC